MLVLTGDLRAQLSPVSVCHPPHAAHPAAVLFWSSATSKFPADVGEVTRAFLLWSLPRAEAKAKAP